MKKSHYGLVGIAIFLGTLVLTGFLAFRASLKDTNLTPIKQPEPVSQSKPHVLPERAKGKGWYCMKSAAVQDVSSCFRTEKQCELGRKKMSTGQLQYFGCLPQEGAACFTFYSVVRQTDSFDCSATMAACERQRLYGIGQTKDFKNVSDCGVVP